MPAIRLILAAASLVTVLGLICLVFVPEFNPVIDIGAGLFGLATWIVPLLLIAAPRKKPKSSLASVGRFIGMMVVAAYLSAMGISLALLSLIFAQSSNWAWPALIAIAAFWVSGGILIGAGGRRSRAGGEISK